MHQNPKKISMKYAANRYIFNRNLKKLKNLSSVPKQFLR